MTRIGPQRVRTIRVRGGNVKQRALRLDTGNFTWGTEVCTRKTRVLDVVYNASNNELVRTKTLVKNSIIQIDASPFKAWYEQHYGVKVGQRKKKEAEGEAEKKSKSVLKKLAERQKTRTLDPALDSAFGSGRLLACISSRPGQSGRCDGYILEGKELEFYSKMLKRKK
jgi:small subunit ribosomal protein S8e